MTKKSVIIKATPNKYVLVRLLVLLKIIKKTMTKEMFTMKNLDAVYAEKIAEEYSQKSESKVVALKKLDSKAKRPAEIFAYSFGIVSALILGLGMCLSMGVIGNQTAISMIVGIIIGITGIVMVSVNFPIYKRILNSRKRKYAFEILEIAKEITDGSV